MRSEWVEKYRNPDFDALQGKYGILIPHTKAHTPSRHAVAFRHGKELHPHVFGTFCLQKTGCLVAVKNDVRIGKIVNDHNVVRSLVMPMDAEYR